MAGLDRLSGSVAPTRGPAWHKQPTALDQKAAWLFSAVTVLLGGAIYFVQLLGNEFLPPESAAEAVLLLMGLVPLGTALWAWRCLLHALRGQRLEVLTVNQELLEFWRKNARVNIYYFIAKQCAKAHHANRYVIHVKGEWVERGYKALTSTLMMLLVYAAMYAGYTWTNNGG